MPGSLIGDYGFWFSAFGGTSFDKCSKDVILLAFEVNEHARSVGRA